MRISYNRLWKLLIDREMSCTDLRQTSGSSTYRLARLEKNLEVTMTTLRKITSSLECSMDDVVEFIPDSEKMTLKNTEKSGSMADFSKSKGF